MYSLQPSWRWKVKIPVGHVCDGCRLQLESMSKHFCLCETEWEDEWMKRWSLSVPFCCVVSCRVDASNLEGTSLHIKKLRAVSACKMKINSVPKEEITVSSDSELSFQDCLPEDLQITAMRAIGTFILTNVLLCIFPGGVWHYIKKHFQIYFERLTVHLNSHIME